MTAPTTPDVRLDEHTEAELQPPCEVIEVALCLIHGRHVDTCHAPAEWILRAACPAGHVDTTLICGRHRDVVGRLTGGCEQCGYHGEPATISVERL